MRSKFMVAIAIAMLPLTATTALGAPMSTSDLLKPKGVAEPARCYRVCKAWGYCGYGYNKYRCCKYWHRHCTYH
jgi:hypothetical protein